MDPFLDLWHFDDPAASRTRFEAYLHQAEDFDLKLQTQTQIARTLGLEKRFDEAGALLDEVHQELSKDTPVATVRYQLERGRVFRSSGRAEDAIPCFQHALEAAKAAKADGLLVDAYHMLALVDTAGADAWHEAAISLAECSTQPEARRWRASLYQNMGWSAYNSGDYALALERFSASVAAALEMGSSHRAEIAQWCQARVLRELGRYAEAMAIQSHLAQARPSDGFVAEELALLHGASHNLGEATHWANLAANLMLADGSWQEIGQDRQDRLTLLAGPEES